MDYDCGCCRHESECKLAYEESDCLVDTICEFNKYKDDIKFINNKLSECLTYIKNKGLEDKLNDLYRNIEFTKEMFERDEDEVEYAINFKKYMNKE